MRCDSEEMAPYEVFLKSLCHVIPVVNVTKKGQYASLCRNFRLNSIKLVQNDELFTDIAELLTLLQGLGGASAAAGGSLQSFDELRLAEEISMEDTVFSNAQIKRSMAKAGGSRSSHPGRADYHDEPSEVDVASAEQGRLRFIKSDFFSDFCSYGESQ